MPFRQRNVYHLRISASEVLPLYLYLDDRHLDWMTERTLSFVIADLKPLIGPKLEAERSAHYGPGGSATAKRGAVEVHRGDGYQFAYFLRKAEPHPIIFKTRNYVMINNPKSQNNLLESKPDNKRRQSGSPDCSIASSRKNVKRQKQSGPSKGKRKKKKNAEVVRDSEEEAGESSSADMSAAEEGDYAQAQTLRRSTRRTSKVPRYHELPDEDSEGSQRSDRHDSKNVLTQPLKVKLEEEIDADAILHTSSEAVEPSTESRLDIDMEDEETKVKPSLQLSFRQLNMRDRYLCIVVEPWPVLPDASKTTSSTRFVTSNTLPSRISRAPSIAPSNIEVGQREQTPMPLFLPSHDERDRSATPAPIRFQSVLSGLETMDDSAAMTEDGGFDFGMIAFSQALSNVVGDHPGGLDDDDEMDGNALYGDADEMRTMAL